LQTRVPWQSGATDDVVTDYATPIGWFHLATLSATHLLCNTSG